MLIAHPHCKFSLVVHFHPVTWILELSYFGENICTLCINDWYQGEHLEVNSKTFGCGHTCFASSPYQLRSPPECCFLIMNREIILEGTGWYSQYRRHNHRLLREWGAPQHTPWQATTFVPKVVMIKMILVEKGIFWSFQRRGLFGPF